MRSFVTAGLASGLTALILLTGSAFATDNSQIIHNIGENVILETYLSLAQSAQALQNDIKVLAATPNDTALKAAQDQWKKMRSYYESSEAFLFGPVAALNIDPALDTYPITVSDVDTILGSNSDLTPQFIASLGVNLQGFHVAEYLLFGNGVNGPNKPAAALTTRELEYLQAVSQIMVDQTTLLSDSWTKNADPDQPNLPGFGQLLTQPGPNNPYYKSEKAVLNELVLGMVGTIDELANGKLTDPMGKDIASADASLLESTFSWNSLEDLKNNLRSANAVYTGSYAGVTGPGLHDFVMSTDASLDAQIVAQITKAQASLEALPGPQGLDLRVLIKDHDGRARITSAIAEINALRDLISDKVLPIVEALP
jgi:putative iron-regulated protein